MKALRWHGVKDLSLENIEQPAALAGKVKIKVEWCGICGSDLHGICSWTDLHSPGCSASIDW